MSKEIPKFYIFPASDDLEVELNKISSDYDVSFLPGGDITNGLQVSFDAATNSLIFCENISEYAPRCYAISLQSFLAVTGITLDNANELITVYAPFEARPKGFDKAADIAYDENMERYYAEQKAKPRPEITQATPEHSKSGHIIPMGFNSYFSAARFTTESMPVDRDKPLPLAPE